MERWVGAMESAIEAPSIFISYARSDSTALAEEPVAGLEVAGFKPSPFWTARTSLLPKTGRHSSSRPTVPGSSPVPRTTPLQWLLFGPAQKLVDAARASVPRCLSSIQREAFHLDARPPRWCFTRHLWPFTGPGRSHA